MAEIIAKDIYKDYVNQEVTTNVIKGIDVVIDKREFCAIVGPSGSGKSTLLYILSGLEPPTSGEISLFGKNLKELSKKDMQRLRQENLGFVFQFYNLISNLTVYENVMLPLIIRKEPNDNRVQEVLRIVGMEDYKDYFPYQLSGGMQQKIAIARSLVNGPELIFADEPTGNLDNKSGHEVMELLQRLNMEQGITIVLVTHNLDHVRYCRRKLELRDGRIVNDERIDV